MNCRHYEEWTGGCDEMERGIDHVWCEPCPYANENEMKSCENYEAKVTKCKYCNGRGLVAIGENTKGLKECPYCDGTGLINR